MILASSHSTTAGPLGLLLILLLGVATVFLIRNMNGRLRRLPREFPSPPAKDEAKGGAKGEAKGGARGEGEVRGESAAEPTPDDPPRSPPPVG